MAAIDFPASPTTGQLFSAANGVTYLFNGTIWIVQAGPGGGTGDFQAFSSNAGSSTSVINQVLPTVITGNAGLWYSTSTGRYTPPAGRYRLQAQMWGYSSGGVASLQSWITKNGTAVTANAASQATSGASNYGSVTYECIVDANGTDWFSMQTQTNPALSVSVAMFNGAPLTGMQGPMGPSGNMLINGTGAPTGLTAAKGTLYINTTATTTTTRLYINTDGATTWANFTASA